MKCEHPHCRKRVENTSNWWGITMELCPEHRRRAIGTICPAQLRCLRKLASAESKRDAAIQGGVLNVAAEEAAAVVDLRQQLAGAYYDWLYQEK